MVDLSNLEYIPKFISAKEFAKLFCNETVTYITAIYNDVIYDGYVVDKYKDVYIIEWVRC